MKRSVPETHGSSAPVTAPAIAPARTTPANVPAAASRAGCRKRAAPSRRTR